MSKQMPIIVSHYTKDTGYEQEVEHLISSLNKWGLQYDIEEIESLGSWRRNSNYCSRLVQKMMAKYPNRDILRVDADAVFQRFPDLFLQDDFMADVAAHIANFRWHPNELLGGTIFFRNKPTVRWLVDYWTWESTVNQPEHRNPDLLKEIIDRQKFNVVFSPLPATYCKIFDIMRDVEDPVIEHFQASRKYKKQVNRVGVKK
jgi:hypothetical protein